MKCQFFPFLGVLFALAFAPGLTSVHAAGETALDRPAPKQIKHLCAGLLVNARKSIAWHVHG